MAAPAYLPYAGTIEGKLSEMKRLYFVAVLLLLLTGCEKRPAVIAPKELFQVTDGVTADGVREGDGPEQFIDAYKGYTIQVAYNHLESSYVIMDIDEIPYEEDISTIIANFFIDGKPVSEEELCTENKVKPTQLYTLLSSPEYLRDHNVVYRYLRFRWADGLIAGIQSDELNYNETYETPQIH